jgi:hypothetical protein
VDEAVRVVAARMPTYITLKDVKRRWGKGQEDIFPVAQFEKLWGDMTALPELDCRFVAVPRVRGQQLKEPAQLDAWLRDGSAAYTESLCMWRDKGDIVKARGSASRFDDRLQMKIDQLRLAQPGEVDKSDLLPSTTYDVSALWAQLLGFVESLTNPDLKRLLTAMLDDPALAQAYREAPAAKQLHHAWLGGLLEHVISLCTLADRVVPHYPLLDRDLVLTGVILHDIGKVRELSWEIGFEYTIEGTLLGHIQMGAALTEKTIDSCPISRRNSKRWSCT